MAKEYVSSYAAEPEYSDDDDAQGDGARDGADSTRALSVEPSTAPPIGQGALTNKRKSPRRATSAVAYTAPPPAPDDPLLSFAPVPHKAPRRNSITAKLQREFIAQLAATGIVSEAARHIGKSTEAIYNLRQRPGAEEFRAAWDAAIDRGVSRLESGALARAIEGRKRLVTSNGKVLGMDVQHNEGLVMFFLRNRLPARYGPKAHEAAFEEGHPEYDALVERLRGEWEEEQYQDRHSPENKEANIKFFMDLKAKWRKDWEMEAWAKEAEARVLGRKLPSSDPPSAEPPYPEPSNAEPPLPVPE